MAIVNQDLYLEITPGAIPPILNVTEYDENMQVVVHLRERGQAYEIPSGVTAKVEGTLTGHPFRVAATPAPGEDTVTFELSEAMTGYAGRAWTKIKLIKDNKPVHTCGFWLDCDRAGVQAGDVIAMTGFEQQLKDGVYDYLDDKQLASIAFLPMGLVPSGTDLDTLTESGHYLIAGSSNFQYEHNPLPAGHTGVLLVYKESATYGTQVMHDMWPGGKLTYRRSRGEQADFLGREWAQLSGEKSLKMLLTYDYTSCDDVHEACVLFLSTGSSQPTPQITDFPFPECGWLITYDTSDTNTRAQTAIRYTDGYQLHRVCTFAGVWSEWTSNIELSNALVVQPRNDYSSCDDVDESCVLFNTDFGGTYTFSDFPFNEAGWLITIKSFAAYATRLQIAISFGSLGVKFRKCNISGAWGAWSTGGGGEVLASCDLDTVIGGGIGFYLLISDNSYTHTPEGLGMGFLLKLTAGDWTYQIFFSLTDHKVWSRTYGLGVVDGVVTPMWRNEWTRLGGSGGGGNHYENTYNITCNPTITTDTNNYLASPGDTTDMTGAIQTMLNTTGACNLGPGDFYITGIEIPNNGTLRGSGTRTRLILAQSVSEGYAVKLKTYSCIKDLQILGQTAQYTPMSPVGKRDGIVFEGTADAKMNPTVYYRSTIENVILANFHGSAIRCENTGLNVAENLHVTDVFAYWCDVGINIAYLSEFHRWTNVSVTGCYYGCICNGGNNNFANCDFSGNTLGLLIDDSAGTSLNNSHGTFSACSFNHSGSNSGTAIRILGADNGEVFTGCQIFYGAIEIDSSIGIRFVGANIGRAVPIRVTNSKVVSFSDSTFYSASEDPITQSSNTAFVLSNCHYYNGAEVTT